MGDNRKSIFVLESVMPREHPTEDVEYKYNQNELGEVECIRDFIGVYDSIDKAEADMLTLIKSNNDCNAKYGGWVEYFCFIITEKYLNDALYGDCNISYFESTRTYLGDGRLNCISDYDERCEKKFTGRDEKQPYVNNGDFCWLLSYDKLIPIYLAECSPTKEELAKRFPNGYVGDFTDDSGLAVRVNCGHTHPFSTHVFPESLLKGGSIPDKVKSMLMDEWKAYERGDIL